MAAATIDDADAQLRAIITNLYMLIVQAHDHQGPGTQQAMTAEMCVSPQYLQESLPNKFASKRLVQNLLSLCETARRLQTNLPLDVIQFLDEGRNPDIYTRNMVEYVMRFNQQQKGWSDAFGNFRDILGQQMVVGIPDIKEDVQKVVEATGGHVE